MSFHLKIVEGPDKDRWFTLDDGGKLTIGRGEDSDTKLTDAAVSRIHCEVARHGNTVTVRDLGSSSGTKINGQDIDQAEIHVGTIFRIGNSLLRLDQPKLAGMDTKAGTEGGGELTVARPLEELVGTVLGRYEIRSIIGPGVTGVVFLAHDQEKDRDAAVKVLTPQFSRSDEQRHRFVRAMKTMMPIRDPYIVRLYNAGISGPYCWAAMEFIDGENLNQLIDRIGIEHMLDWKQVWRVAMNIGHALQTGFEHKIIHRNVTPTNILRRSSDKACLLGDFMLAKALEGEEAVELTVPGQIVGDVPYMAPERTLPDADVDTRSDIYGLGATCYALLTGHPPAVGKSLPELIDRVRNQQPAPPKTFQLSVDDMFQDVVMKMIAKEPARRFQTPTELTSELQRIGKFNNLQTA